MGFFYIDGSNVCTLFEHTLKDVENEFDTLYRADPIGSLQAKTALARRLGELLGVGELKKGASPYPSRKYIDEIKAKLTVENKASRLVEYQREVDSTSTSPSLDMAIRRWRYDGTNMLYVYGHFNMPQFCPGSQGEALAYESGFVEFELDRSAGLGLGRRGPSAFGGSGSEREQPRVLISAYLSKFSNVRFGKMSSDSPEARYFHQFKGSWVPLHVLGTLARQKDNLRIKPVVIWR